MASVGRVADGQLEQTLFAMSSLRRAGATLSILMRACNLPAQT